MIEQALKEDYLIASISFEGMGEEFFYDELKFCKGFLRLVARAVKYHNKDMFSEIMKLESICMGLEWKDKIELTKEYSQYILWCEGEVAKRVL